MVISLLGDVGMADIEKRIWGIHTYDEALFLKDDKMAIGWKEIGNLREIPANRDDFKKKYVQVYPDASKGAVATCAGMLYALTLLVTMEVLIITTAT
jgi:restriction system protein